MPDLPTPPPGLTVEVTPTNATFMWRGGGWQLSTDPSGTHARLLMGRTGIGVDVTIQPAAIDIAVADAARTADCDPNRWRRYICAVVADVTGATATRPDDLIATVGAACHPILRIAYGHTVATLGDIPRWLAPALARDNLADALGTLTRTRPNRRLTRTIGDRITTAHTMPLDMLALVSLGEHLSADDIANIADAYTADQLGEPVDITEVTLMRRVLAAWPDSRRYGLLIDTAHNDQLTYLHLLCDRVERLRGDIPAPLPTTLSGLNHACERRLRATFVAPAPYDTHPTRWDDDNEPDEHPWDIPTAAPAPLYRANPGEPIATVTTGDPAAEPIEQFYDLLRIFEPAPAPTPVPFGGRWTVPDALRGIDGHHSRGLTFVVPRSADQLVRWGNALQNCLDTYVADVANGRTWVVGVFRRGDLCGCLEIEPNTRHVLQAEGPGNTPMPDPLLANVTVTMRHLGVLAA